MARPCERPCCLGILILVASLAVVGFITWTVMDADLLVNTPTPPAIGEGSPNGVHHGGVLGGSDAPSDRPPKGAEGGSAGAAAPPPWKTPRAAGAPPPPKAPRTAGAPPAPKAPSAAGTPPPPKAPSAAAAPPPPKAPRAAAAPPPPKAPRAAAAPPPPKAPRAAGAQPPPKAPTAAGALPPPKGHDWGSADAAASATELPPSSSMVKKLQNLVLAFGCVVSMSSFCYPIIVIWSVGGDIGAAADYHTKCDLGATSLSTIAWLMFAISELHIKDGKIIGTAAVISNSIGVAFIGMTILMKVTRGQNMTSKVCYGTFVGYTFTFALIISLSVFGPVEKDSQWAKVFSFVAAASQLLSQILPLHTAYRLFWPADGAAQPAIMNFKKLLITSRAYGLVISVHWAIYCTLTYQHSFFMMVNVISAGLSYFSLFVHLLYCLRPDDPPPAALAQQ